MSSCIHFEYRFDDTIFQAIYPTVQMWSLFMLPCLLNDRCFGKIYYLLLYVQLHKAIASFLFIFQLFKFIAMKAVYILNISDPFIQYTHVMPRCSGFHAAAAIMSANDNVLHL